MNKILWLIFSCTVSVFIIVLCCILFAKFNLTDILLNFVFCLAFIGAGAGLLIWRMKFKQFFENFLVFMVLFFFNLLFIYIGPLTVDRSLSTFMYFYAAERGSIHKYNYNENYYKKFVSRRLEDGVKFGFLKCTDSVCTPTNKGYIFYYILNPIGKITHTDEHYHEFKQTFD